MWRNWAALILKSWKAKSGFKGNRSRPAVLQALGPGNRTWAAELGWLIFASNIEETFMKRAIGAALMLSFFFVANSAFAGFVFFVEEVGSNIKITVSGSLDTTGWAVGNNPPGGSFIRTERVMAGASAPSGVGFVEYGPISSFTVSGGASTTEVFASLGYIPAATSSGDLAGLRFSGSSVIVAAPAGYTSGSSISGTATYNNLTLTSLGMNAGTTWKWYLGAAGDESKSITVTAVPEPGSIALVSGLVAGLSVLGRRRRQA